MLKQLGLLLSFSVLSSLYGVTPPPRFVVVGQGGAFADVSATSFVRVFDASDFHILFDFAPYGAGFTGEIRVAVGDVNGDGYPDIITSSGADSTNVLVFDGKTGTVLRNFAPYPNWAKGSFVASCDVNKDGYADIITGADSGGGPGVNVFSGKDGSLLYSFLAYPSSFTGGVRVGCADVDGDGYADILTAPGIGLAGTINVYSGKNGALIRTIPTSGSAGAYVAGGDLNGDGFADIIVGSGVGAAPVVSVYSGADSSLLQNFLADDGSFNGGIHPAAADINADGKLEIITGSGNAREWLKVFSGQSPLTSVYNAFAPFKSSAAPGIYVAAGTGKLPAAPQFPVALAPHCTPSFPTKHGWLGGDNAFPLTLSSNRTLFLFGDTTVTSPFSTMIGNSLGIGSCDQAGNFSVGYSWGTQTNIAHPAFFNDSYSANCNEDPTKDPYCYRYWLTGDAFLSGGSLYISSFKMSNTTAPGPFNFAEVGQVLIRVTNPGDAPANWKYAFTDLSSLPNFMTIVTDAVYAYFFTPYNVPTTPAPLFPNVQVQVLRVPLNQLGNIKASIQYFAANGTWKAGYSATDALWLAAAGGADEGAKVRFNPTLNQYEMIETRDFGGGAVTLRTASAPNGPWSAPTVILNLPEKTPGNPAYNANLLCYSSFDHLEMSPDPSSFFLQSDSCIDGTQANYIPHFTLAARTPAPRPLSCTAPHTYLSKSGACLSAVPLYWCYNFAAGVGKYSENPAEPAMKSFYCNTQAPFAYLPAKAGVETAPLYAMDVSYLGFNNPIWTNSYGYAQQLGKSYGEAIEDVFQLYGAPYPGMVALTQWGGTATKQSHLLSVDNGKTAGAYGFTHYEGILGYVFPP